MTATRAVARTMDKHAEGLCLSSDKRTLFNLVHNSLVRLTALGCGGHPLAEGA